MNWVCILVALGILASAVVTHPQIAIIGSVITMCTLSLIFTLNYICSLILEQIQNCSDDHMEDKG